jgi:glycosyltransferase involved in cell wall biosynthesis
VIVAAYNVAPLIGDALASAFAQTSPPHEVVVVDDGSTDDFTGAIAPWRDRIVLLRQENRGEGAAKNAAAHAATGEFVVILDADDVDLPRRLEALGALATARPDLDVLTTDCYLVHDGVRVRRRYGDDQPFEVDDQRGEILRRNFIFNPAIRRERFLAVGGFDTSFWATADWWCYIDLLLTGSRAGLVDEPLVEYRERPGRLTGDRVRMLDARVRTVRQALAHPQLTERERAIALESLRTALLRNAHEALPLGGATARTAALQVARESTFPAGTRLRAAAAAVAPAVARRLR